MKRLLLSVAVALVALVGLLRKSVHERKAAISAISATAANTAADTTSAIIAGSIS